MDVYCCNCRRKACLARDRPEHGAKQVLQERRTMQCANELLCVLNVTVQAFYLLCQPHQAFSLLNILSLDLQEPEMLEKLLPSIQWHVLLRP